MASSDIALFQLSKWIWPKSDYQIDDYAEFISSFKVNKDAPILLRIASDSIYAVYLNNELVVFAQCADFPNYKFYDEININKYIKKDNNELKIQVYHSGINSQIYIKDKAGLIFEIIQDNNVLIKSDEYILSRVMNEYHNGYQKLLTRQIGFSFYYDNSVVPNSFAPSIVIDKNKNFYKRKIKPLTLENRQPFKIIKHDSSIVIDLEKETAGFIDLDIASDSSQLLTICYGEHLADKGVRRLVGRYDFSFEVFLKKGRNIYLNPFRRIAGRYLEIFYKESITINYIGIRPVLYPVTIKPVRLVDPLLQKIYDVSAQTLRLCMHEHYEDCPWREQALYTMDSRNQMLFGYYAFNEYEYPRHNLICIAQSQQKTGLLSICAPAGVDISIPMFSLIYLIEVYEYVEYSHDASILDEVKDVIDKIIKTFTDHIDSTGLIPSFPYPCWNYYEWTEDSHNNYQLSAKSNNDYHFSHDLILNAFYVYAVTLYNKMYKKNIDVDKVKEQIQKTFYCNGVYVLSDKTNKYSQFGNALALLIGLGDNSIREKIINDKNMISATLSTLPFVYDALLKEKKYCDFVLKDIKEKYKHMLNQGATSFWETIKGEKDFGGAGSLCHGWSAMPIYYFHLLGLVK